MKRLLLVLLIVMFAVVLPSCSNGGGAKELFDTAELEVTQNNKEHAASLYQEIVKKYPDSEYAKKAQDKLSQLKSTQ